MRRDAGLHDSAGRVAIGHYVGVLAPRNAALRDAVERHPARARCATARSSAIFRKWNVWNDDQPALYAQRARAASRSAGRSASTTPAARRRLPAWDATLRYLPSLLRAAVVTLVLSCLSMALAVALGVLIATGRVYGDAARARRCSRSTSS